MSGHGTIEVAVQATKLGAFDFIEKPLSSERILLALKNALGYSRLRSENEVLRLELERKHTLVGSSKAAHDLIQLIRQVAPSDSRVLITGENGSGKELVARTIHKLSPRSAGPFVPVNCAAIPRELIESEMFGHEKGAFTGAHKLRHGRFELANGGTLFLDEIGDMSPEMQAKFLRAIEEGCFERVGGVSPISVDVRTIAATNQDIKQAVESGRFREDLYYRLNVIHLVVPPLRDRPSDIKPIAEHYASQISSDYGRPLIQFQEDALKLLEAHPWPGNVRELRNVVEHLVIMSPTPQIEARHVARLLSGARTHASDAGGSLREQVGRFERETIEETLRRAGWNVTQAAEMLKIERSHLYKKMRALGIQRLPALEE
jgi:two-component system nitrogen regulation response regulator NtrX